MSTLTRVLEPEAMDSPQEASDYDAMDHSGPNAAFCERAAELGASGRMLDLGCGPGHLLPRLCDAVPGSTVLGIDLSNHMLERAERRRLASAHAERIDLALGDAKRIDFPDATFDAVLSNTILHHIPDPRPFLAEAHRVLRPGGTLLIRDLFRPIDAAEVARLVDLHAAEATPDQRELFRASLCAAFTADELRALLAKLELDDVEVVIDTDRHLSIQRRAS